MTFPEYTDAEETMRRRIFDLADAVIEVKREKIANGVRLDVGHGFFEPEEEIAIIVQFDLTEEDRQNLAVEDMLDE